MKSHLWNICLPLPTSPGLTTRKYSNDDAAADDVGSHFTYSLHVLSQIWKPSYIISAFAYIILCIETQSKADIISVLQMRKPELKEIKSRAQGQTLPKGRRRDFHCIIYIYIFFHCIILSAILNPVSPVQHSCLSQSVLRDSEAKYEIGEQKYFPPRSVMLRR